MQEIVIHDFLDINQIVTEIHDQWFDINEIKFLNEMLSIKFNKEQFQNHKVVQNFIFWKKIKIPIVEYFLKIYNVKKIDIVDNEKVQLYDFNTMNYLKEENKITIETGIPLKFEIIISDFKLSIEKTNNILDWKEKTILF
jgi:hypothetical protein